MDRPKAFPSITLPPPPKYRLPSIDGEPVRRLLGRVALEVVPEYVFRVLKIPNWVISEVLRPFYSTCACLQRFADAFDVDNLLHLPFLAILCFNWQRLWVFLARERVCRILCQEGRVENVVNAH